MAKCDSILRDLEDSINLIDLLTKYIISLTETPSIPSGVKFQSYRILVDLREKIVSARMGLVEMCYGS